MALEALGAAPPQVRFLDDRPRNVQAARAVGIHAELFTGPAQVDAIPLT